MEKWQQRKSLVVHSVRHLWVPQWRRQHVIIFRHSCYLMRSWFPRASAWRTVHMLNAFVVNRHEMLANDVIKWGYVIHDSNTTTFACSLRAKGKSNDWDWIDKAASLMTIIFESNYTDWFCGWRCCWRWRLIARVTLVDVSYNLRARSS